MYCVLRQTLPKREEACSIMGIVESDEVSAGSASAVVRELAVAVVLALVAWAVGTASMWLTFWVASVNTGFAVRGLIVPVAFYLVSVEYFLRRRALAPLLVAVTFTCVALMADAAVAFAFGARVYDIPRSLLGTWLPAAATLVVTWMTGIGTARPKASDV